MIDLHVDWTHAARPGRRVGHVIEAHRVIGSTNDRARELLADPLVDGIVVVADEQTAGRGRGARTWYSPADHSLSMSAALRPRIAVADAWQLALGTALAASEACDPVAATELKWPNDLVGTDGRKLGGILIETIIEGDRLLGAVIGIGMNVDWRRAAMPDEIRDTATSLADLGGGTPIDRILVLDRLLDRLSDELARLEDGQTPVDRYRARCRTIGERVRVALGARTIEGLAIEVDEGGALVVESAAGRQRIASGEVQQVRGA